MKKLYSEEKFKRFNHGRSLKKIKTHKGSRQQPTNYHYLDGYVHLPAPKNFSFIKNTRQVLIYLDKIDMAIRHRKKLILDLSKIQHISPETLVLLLAFVKSKASRSISIRGINPVNQECLNMVLSSGFMDYVQAGVGEKKSNNGKITYTETRNKVEPILAKDVCVRALGRLRGEPFIFSPLYEIIIECMANTNNHANLKKQGFQKWCLSFYYDAEVESCIFCFVDLGIGIMRSVPRKRKQTSTIKGLRAESDELLFEDILNGNTFSRTDRLDRGKGLPLIYKHSQNKEFAEFIVVTNQIYSDLKKSKTTKIPMAFNGTFLFWELVDPESKKIDKKGQYLLWKPKN